MTVENTPQDESINESPSLQRVTSHFWFCAYPFFEPVIYFIPEGASAVTLESSEETLPDLQHQIRIFDCDGDLINEVEASFPKGQLGWVECEPLLAACKFDSGVRHGTIEVTSTPGFIHKIGLLSAEQPLLFVPIKTMVKNVGEFFPIYYNSNRKVYLAAINQSNKEANVRCRLVVHQRSPEIELKIPANSARIVSVWDTFSEAFDVGTQDGLLSYLRCNLRGDGNVGFTMLEVQENKGQHSFGF